MSRWTVRLAAFGVALILTGVALHRLAGMSTSIALALSAIAFAVAGCALLFGLQSFGLDRSVDEAYDWRSTSCAEKNGNRGCGYVPARRVARKYWKLLQGRCAR